jgi:hypothetical protein
LQPHGLTRAHECDGTTFYSYTPHLDPTTPTRSDSAIHVDGVRVNPSSLHAATYAVPLTPTIRPLEVLMRVSGGTHSSAQARSQTTCVDTGSGSSFISKHLSLDLRAKVSQSDTPFYYAGFTPGHVQSTSEYALVHRTFGDVTTVDRFWVVPEPPLPLLLGRDNMRACDGRALLINADPDAPSITVATSGVTVSCSPCATPWHPDATETTVTTTLPAVSSCRLEVSLPSHPNTELCFAESHLAPQVIIPACVVRTSASGTASVVALNLGITTATVSAHTTVAGVMRHCATATDAAHHQSLHTLYTESLPTRAEDLRGPGWSGSAAHGEAAEPSTFTDNTPAAKDIDAELQKLCREATVGSIRDRRRLLRLLRDMNKVGLFSTAEDRVGTIRGYTHSFRRNTHEPTFHRQYPTPPHRSAEMARQADLLLAEGIVHPTTSPFNCPTLLVSKGVGKAPRFCCDLRNFNRTIVPEYFELPNIRTLVADLATFSIFSKMDMSQGYHCVELSTDDGVDGGMSSADMIAFTLADGRRFAYGRLPFGVTDGSSIFSKLLARTIRSENAHARQYVDDIFSGAHEVDEHLINLERLLPLLAADGFKLSVLKCEFLRSETTALGSCIANHRITPDPGKSRAIRDLRAPTSHKELEMALGVLGVARRFAPDFDTHSRILYELLGTARWTPSTWTLAHQAAFDQVKASFTSSDALWAPDFSRPFEIWADANDTACGATLVQRDDDGAVRAIEYHSHGFTAAERRYTVSEREALAILLACTAWRSYLLSVPRFSVLIRSDHRSLMFIHRSSDTNSRLYRWVLALSEFNYDLVYTPGDSQFTADAISRLTPAVTLVAAVAATRAALDSPATPTDRQSVGVPHALATPRGTLPTAVVTVALGDDRCRVVGQRGQPQRDLCDVLPAPVQPTTVAPVIPAPTDFVPTRLRQLTTLPGGTTLFYRVEWQDYPNAVDHTFEPHAAVETWPEFPALHARFLARDLATLTTDSSLKPIPGFDAIPTQAARRIAALNRSARQRAARAPTTTTPGADPPPPSMPTHATTPPLTDETRWAHAEPAPQLPTGGGFRPRTTDHTDLLPSLTVRDLRVAQRADTALAAIIDTAPDLPPFYSIDEATGLLFYDNVPTTGIRAGDQLSRLAVPTALEGVILLASHEASGHLGADATLFHVHTRFHFPGMTAKVRSHVASCTTCLRSKRQARPHQFGHIPVFDWNDSVGIDFAGPFDRSLDGNKHLAIMTDHSCKWLHTHATLSTSAADAAGALVSWVQHNGWPRRIFSDRGSAFTSQVWSELLAAFGIRHRKTTAYNPRGDSHAESQVGNAKHIITSIAQSHPNRWDEAAKWATIYYNSSYHSTIGTTPYFARHGREPNTAADHLLSTVTHSDSISLSELVRRVQRIRAAVQEGVDRLSARVDKHNAGLRHVPTFAEGDRVYLHRVFPSRRSAGINRAFFWPYRPELYTIAEVMSPQHVRITCPTASSRNRNQVVHVHRLKRHSPRAEALDFSAFIDHGDDPSTELSMSSPS